MVLLPSPATGSLCGRCGGSGGWNIPTWLPLTHHLFQLGVCPIVGPAGGRPAPERSVCLTAAAGQPRCYPPVCHRSVWTTKLHFAGGKRHDFSPGLAVLVVGEGTPPCLGPGSLLEPPRRDGPLPRSPAAVGVELAARPLPGQQGWPGPLLGWRPWRRPWGLCTALEQVALSCRRAVLVQGRSGERRPAVGLSPGCQEGRHAHWYRTLARVIHDPAPRWRRPLA